MCSCRWEVRSRRTSLFPSHHSFQVLSSLQLPLPRHLSIPIPQVFFFHSSHSFIHSSMASFVGLTVDAPGSGHSHQPSTPSMSRASCFKLLYLSWHKDRRRKHPMFLSPGAYPILISFATWFFDLTLTLFLVSSTTEAAPPKKRQALARPEEHLSQGEGSSPRPAQSKKRITHNRVPDSESEKDDGSEKGDGSETDNISEKGHNSDSEEYDDSVM